VRGELSEEEIVDLEADLDRRPSLHLALGEVARRLGASTRVKAASAIGASIVDGPGRLTVGPTLGEGGMSTVRHGVQTNLGRAVAVKMLRDETPSGTHRLLQEARLTARLQHPNIVPVHEIIQGRAGELQIVLKQVDGVPWSTVMRAPEALRARFGVEDALDWNLRVLIAICNALAYAHDRGVIHRDVKPGNVMVGRFGEVYLLDWGLAALWGDRSDPEIAHVEDAPVAGTPAYMAPEPAEGDADALGPWTDVYLLGATLYELLAGVPPHTETRKQAQACPRERVVRPLPPEVPAGLAAIVQQAMRPNPEERLVTPEELRARLEAFRSSATPGQAAQQGGAAGAEVPAHAEPDAERAAPTVRRKRATPPAEARARALRASLLPGVPSLVCFAIALAWPTLAPHAMALSVLVIVAWMVMQSRARPRE